MSHWGPDFGVQKSKNHEKISFSCFYRLFKSDSKVFWRACTTSWKILKILKNHKNHQKSPKIIKNQSSLAMSSSYMYNVMYSTT